MPSCFAAMIVCRSSHQLCSYSRAGLSCALGANGRFKHIPVPKLTIPLGLDSEGRPVSVTAWGRAVPVEHLYDDDYARIHDLEWLHKVGAVVEALHANGSGLQRVEPPCNADLISSS